MDKDLFQNMRDIVYKEFKALDYDNLLSHEEEFYNDILDCFAKYMKNLCEYRKSLEVTSKNDKKKYNSYIDATKVNEELCTLIAMEECGELIQAISKGKRGKLDKENLTEEIADVIICIDWLKRIYGISENDLGKWLYKKKVRVIEKINNDEFK